MTPPPLPFIIALMFSTTPQEPDPEPNPPSLADIVRQETEDGRLIVRFLVDLMQGRLEQAEPCHRLDAARQLLGLGLLEAQTFIDANTAPARRRSPAALSPCLAPAALRHELAALVREETQDGRATVRFLVDVMQGSLAGFKPHHRLCAAKELLRRGFDSPEAAPAGDYAEDAEAAAPLDLAQDTDRQYRYAGYPAGYNRYQQEPGPFDPVFDNYDADDYYFDCYGVYAMRYLLGGAEAHKAAVKAVFNYRCHISQAAGRDFLTESDPEDSPELVPAAAPLPQDIYGFKALLWIFNTPAAVRVAAKAAAEYHRQQSALAGRHPGPAPEYAPQTPSQEPLPEDDHPPDDCPPPQSGWEWEWEPEPKPAPPRPTMLEEIRARRRRGEEDYYPDALPSYSSITIPLFP